MRMGAASRDHMYAQDWLRPADGDEDPWVSAADGSGGLWPRPTAGAREAEALDTRSECAADRGAQSWRFRARERGP